MTTSVQSASSQPSARDLLNLLLELQTTNPESLDKPIGTFDPEYDGYDEWQGKLEIEDDMICLSYWPNDAIKTETETARRDSEAARQAHDLELRNRHPVDLSDPVQVARDAGLLPPGA